MGLVGGHRAIPTVGLRTRALGALVRKSPGTTGLSQGKCRFHGV